MENLIASRPESFGAYRDRALESLQQIGIRYVEVHVPPAGEVEGLGQRLKEHGLQVSSGAFYDKALDPQFLEKVHIAVEGTAALGGRVLFTSQHAGEHRAEVFQRLREAGE